MSTSNTLTQERANELFQNIWSPYCKGVSLLECPSGQAENLRQKVREQIELGASDQEIQDNLLNIYGASLRMVPSSSGRESLAYSLPWIAFGLGLALFFAILFAKRKKKKARIIATATPAQEINAVLKDLERLK